MGLINGVSDTKGTARPSQRANGHNRVIASHVSNRAALADIKNRTNPDFPVLIIRDTVNVYYSVQKRINRRLPRRGSKAERDERRAQLERQELQRGTDDLKATFDTPGATQAQGYRLFDVPDGQWRPDAKLFEALNRRTRRGLLKKYAQQERKAAKQQGGKKWTRGIMGSLEEFAATEINHMVIAQDDEADLAYGVPLVQAADMREEAELKRVKLQMPTEEEDLSPRDRFVHTLAAVPAINIIVMTGDSDDYMINTSRERGWTLSPMWYGKAERFVLTDSAAPPPQATGPGPGPPAGIVRAFVVAAEGMDALPGFGRDRSARICRALVHGQDYSGVGIRGVGYRVLNAGILEASLKIPWTLVNAPEVLRLLTADIQRLFGADEASKAWRRDRGLTRGKGSVGLVVTPAVVLRLVVGYEALHGRRGPRFDPNNLKGYHVKLMCDPIVNPKHADLPGRAAVPEQKKLWRTRLAEPQATVVTTEDGVAKVAENKLVPFDPRGSNPLRPKRNGVHDAGRRRSCTDRQTGQVSKTRAKLLRKGPSKCVHRPIAQGKDLPSIFEEIRNHGPEPAPPPPKVLDEPAAATTAADAAVTPEEQAAIEEEIDDERMDREEAAALEEEEKALEKEKATADGEAKEAAAGEDKPKDRHLDKHYTGVTTPSMPLRKVERALVAAHLVVTAQPAAIIAAPAANQVDKDDSGAQKKRRNRSGSEKALKRAIKEDTKRPPRPPRPRSSTAAAVAASPTPAPRAPPPSRTPPATTAPADSAARARSTDTPPPGPPPPPPPPPAVVQHRPVAHLLGVLYFVVQASLVVVMASWRRWIEAQIELGEKGFERCKERSGHHGISRLLAHMLLAASDPQAPASLEPDAKERRVWKAGIEPDVDQAVYEECLSRNYDRPPAVAQGLVAQALDEYGTAVGEATTRSLEQDLGRLGEWFGQDVVERAQAVMRLTFAGRRLVVDTSDARAALAAVVEPARTSLNVALGRFVKAVVLEAPFSDERAARGSAAAQQPSGATCAQQLTALGAEELDEILDGAGLGFQALDVAMLVSSVVDALLAWRDRCVELAVTSGKVAQSTNLDGKVLKDIVSGNKAAIGSLYPLVYAIRRQLGTDDVVPTFEPTFFKCTVDELTRLMVVKNSKCLFDGGGKMATAMFARIARSIKIEHEKTSSGKVRPSRLVEVIKTFLDVFEPVAPDGKPVQWPKGSGRKAFEGPDDPRRGNETAEVVRELVRVGEAVRFVVPAAERARLAETYDALQKLLDTKVAVATHMHKAKNAADVVNILFKRDGFDKALVPTGSFHYSANEIKFYAVKINRVRKNIVKGNSSILGADIGRHWSEVSTSPSTVLDTSDNWRKRASSGAVIEYMFVAGQAVARAIPPLTPPLKPIEDMAKEASVRAHLVSLVHTLYSAGGWAPTEKVANAFMQLGEAHLELCAARELCALANIRGPVLEGSWSPPGSTLMGVPRRWPRLSTPQGLAEVQQFTAGVPDDKLGQAAFDPGEHRPFTAAVSMPSARGRRDESVVHVKRGGMLGLSRRAQQHAAAFYEVFHRDLVFDTTDPALHLDGKEARVVLDTADPLVNSTLSTLYRVDPRRQELESEAKLRLEGEYSSIADEVRRALTGGERRKPPAGFKLVVSVGNGIFARSGLQSGASTTAGLLRKLEERLNMVTTQDGKPLEYMIVIVPEDFTSQCCPRPSCVDAEGRRNRMLPAKRETGSVDGALHFCPACSTVWGHDNAGAVNILAQTMTMQCYGRKMWDKRWGKEMWTTGTAEEREAKWSAKEEAKARARARAGS